MTSGRLRTKIDDLPEDWEKIILSVGKDGGSAVEARSAIGIGRSAWETLLADSDVFRATVEEAQTLCQVWWEANGRKLAIDGGGNATIWKFNMQNRFGWSDKQQTDHTSSDGSMTPKRIEIIAPSEE